MTSIVHEALVSLRAFGELTREEAERRLTDWGRREQLTESDRAQVLAQYPPSAPPVDHLAPLVISALRGQPQPARAARAARRRVDWSRVGSALSVVAGTVLLALALNVW